MEHPLQEEDTITSSSLMEQFDHKNEIICALYMKILEWTDEKDKEAEAVESEEAPSVL